jgi:hypothetical protein
LPIISRNHRVLYLQIILTWTTRTNGSMTTRRRGRRDRLSHPRRTCRRHHHHPAPLSLPSSRLSTSQDPMYRPQQPPLPQRTTTAYHSSLNPASRCVHNPPHAVQSRLTRYAG